MKKNAKRKMVNHRKNTTLSILLINPPRSPYNSILSSAPEEAKPFIHKKLIGPPLGLLTIAESVKEHRVRVLDMKGEYDLNPHSPDIALLTYQWLEKTNPHIVGVTFIASEFDFGIEIFTAVKKYNPEIVTIAGGLYVTLCPDQFTDPSVDILIPGQSPHIFKKCVQSLVETNDCRSVGGTIINNSGKLTKNPPPKANYDTVGKDYIQPDRSLIKKWIQTYRVGTATVPSTYIYTSLGCPYHCTFCSIWPQMNGHYYQRDVESVIKELKSIDDYPIVRFADANTIVNPDFIQRLFSRIAEEQIQKEYIMDIRFDTVVKHPDLIEKLAKAGLKVVICGFESYRQEELQKYHKTASVHDIAEAISIFDSNGIMVRGNYIIPPEYTNDDFKTLTDYAASHKVVYAGYTILTPMPGTPLHRSVKNRILDHDLKKYNFFNCVLPTTIALDQFHYNVGKLWMIKRGNEVI